MERTPTYFGQTSSNEGKRFGGLILAVRQTSQRRFISCDFSERRSPSEDASGWIFKFETLEKTWVMLEKLLQHLAADKSKFAADSAIAWQILLP